jgi:outer membrane cobalamin receptor
MSSNPLLMKLSAIILTLVFIASCSTSEKTATDFERSPEISDIQTSISLLDHLKRVSGLNIVERGGETFVFMRGVHTLSGENNVLFVINGRPFGNSFNAIESTVDVNDIQDIRVIRGSMGSQLYGSQGANGVVEITTKT